MKELTPDVHPFIIMHVHMYIIIFVHSVSKNILMHVTVNNIFLHGNNIGKRVFFSRMVLI